jgi:hypothetical protein
VLFAFTQPLPVLQESSVHRLASSQLGAGPPTQLPPAQLSAVVQALLSSQESVLFEFTQPLPVSQKSSVHRLASLQLGAGPPTQLPPEQLSAVVQALLSLQGAVLFAFTQPLPGLQESSVQRLESLQFKGELPTHDPPEQISIVVQELLSLQESVLFAYVQPLPVSQESVVQILESLQSSAGPAMQLPAPLHWSGTVQALLSLSHALPDASNWQVDEQQSPLAVPPSSHSSPYSTVLSPQTASEANAALTSGRR